MGDALAAVDLKMAPPPEPDDDDDDELEAGPAAAEHFPPPGTQPPPAMASPPGDDDEDPDSFAELAGKVATTIGVSVLSGIHRRQGRIPNELDDADVERLEQETTKVVRRGLGDKRIPWWAPVVSAWGMAYIEMGRGARRIGEPAAVEPDQGPAAPPRPTPPPAPAPASPAWAPLVKPPPVKVQGSTPRVA